MINIWIEKTLCKPISVPLRCFIIIHLWKMKRRWSACSTVWIYAASEFLLISTKLLCRLCESSWPCLLLKLTFKDACLKFACYWIQWKQGKCYLFATNLHASAAGKSTQILAYTELVSISESVCLENRGSFRFSCSRKGEEQLRIPPSG